MDLRGLPDPCAVKEVDEVIRGWRVDGADRERLLARFPPRYERVVADHVTFKPGEADAPMPRVSHGTVVGRADDGRGVDALVVELDGSTERPDGSTWHITWSLGPGREAVESNAVIAAHGWDEVESAGASA